MGREASKTILHLGAALSQYFQGEGIDVGCGDDPVLPSVDRFDKTEGDANRLSRHVPKQYDFVFASHVLEHMGDPRETLVDWLSVLKPGGYLIFMVPDEDLYEQGCFPSLFNDDHKHTFTIAKARSWSPVSVNVLELVRGLDAELVSVELQDNGYDRRLLCHRPTRFELLLLTLRRWASRRFRHPQLGHLIHALFVRLGAPVDQTALPDGRLAQIGVVLRRPLAERDVPKVAVP